MQERSIKMGILSLISVGFSLHPAYSQTITPDGSSTLIEHQGQTYQITGGTQAGANLFHSFQKFGLSAGEVAQFLSQPGIENILGRVTGGDPSLINGLLKVTGSNAHLYLMNPAGIIFGPGSRLDIPGSFTATTADRIGFDGGWFNAFGSNDYSTLIGNPNQFSFLQTQPGAIINAGQLTTPGDVAILAETVVNTGTIQGNHVTLAAVPGESVVKLSQPGMLLSLEVEQSQVETGITALDLPQLLTGSGVEIPTDVQPGSVLITNNIQGQTVDLMAAHRVIPLAPELIRTGDGTHHAPTVVLFPENLEDGWAVNLIDFTVDQPYDLLYGGRAGTVSRLILREEEGVGAINATLGRVTDPIDELNIIAEGNQGNLWLGKTWLNHENIGEYQDQIAQWGEHIGPNAALLIYSCFTALGAIGESFVNTIADLTGATVAASTNATSSANYGGDWHLEYRTGDLDIINPFSSETLQDWDGKLGVLTVKNLADIGTDSLRDAVTAAVSGDEIRFNISGTIVLGSVIEYSIKDNIVIDGFGQNVILDGANLYQIFLTGPNTTLKNLTLINGSTGVNGGAIYATGDINLENVMIENNFANGQGGGVFGNNISVINSTIAKNQATGEGGGIFSTGNLTIINSTISSNSTDANGGGIVNGGALTVQNSTIAFNNATGSGGGIYRITVTGTEITNTIIARNTATTHPDISADFTGGILNFNLIGSTDGITSAPLPGTNLIGLDPLLGPLQNNGGPTQTHALLPGSPALNSGDNALTTVTVDQRGNPRISGGRVDIGAYEFQEPIQLITTPSQPTPEGEILQGCPPHCDDENPNPFLNPDPFSREELGTTILDPGVEEIESSFNQEYAEHLDLEEVPTTTLAESQNFLDRITQETGKKPAILYITFVPKDVKSTPDLTRSLIASAQLDMLMPELAQRSRNLAGATDELQLVLVTPEQAPVVKRLNINRAEAVALASSFSRAITRPQGDSYLGDAQQLYEWLIAPMQADLDTHDIDHISIVADAGLRFIPFAALHDGEGFLVQQYSLGLMPSLSLTEQTYTSIQGLPILAMGASEFTDQNPLPAVPLELTFITEQVGSGQKLLNQDFTLARFREIQDQSGYRVVHMGTHGEFNPGSPENSYIELWGDRLTLDRIGELGLNNPPVELLVLSACRTAFGSNEAELGFAGLAVQAGVKSALGSLWYVSDAGTLGLMSGFYQQLQTAPIKAEALRQAQLAMAGGQVYLDGVNLVSGTQTVPLTPELVALGQVDLSHPYYWSAFTMIGSPW